VTGPPSEWAELRRILDDNDRLRVDPRRVLAELRCPDRRRHRLAVVLRSPAGPWVAFRPPQLPGYTPRRGWEAAWIGEAGPRDVLCSCPGVWCVDLDALAERRGVVLAGRDHPVRVPPATGHAPPDEANPFTP